MTPTRVLLACIAATPLAYAAGAWLAHLITAPLLKECIRDHP